MTATYTPCAGSGLTADRIRRMNTAGCGSKYTHLHGKNAGHCPTCGRSFTLAGTTIPRHKAGGLGNAA